jgi:hypothetical protein
MGRNFPAGKFLPGAGICTVPKAQNIINRPKAHLADRNTHGNNHLNQKLNGRDLSCMCNRTEGAEYNPRPPTTLHT